ncbi:hypothetical protein JL720_9431 [Aureococcus anophagefferens]|nr:hypothetical protein JL720_9431 [Aureococcus anophagefferens]
MEASTQLAGYAEVGRSGTDAWQRQQGVAFALLGLLNNFCYVVMLTAALHLVESAAGLVLLANVAPSLLLKAVAPWTLHRVGYGQRVVGCAALSAAAFYGAAAWPGRWRLAAVACASLAAGGGEATFLALAHFYDARALHWWSGHRAAASGRGVLRAAHARGGLDAARGASRAASGPSRRSPPTLASSGRRRGPGGLLELELAPAANPLRGADGSEVPVLHCDPGAAEDADADAGTDADANAELHVDGPSKPDAASAPSPAARFRQLRPYVGPLFVVYLAEYTMSTGATSTIDARGVSRKRFYELASLVYQLGVLVSRSSGGCVRLRWLWTMAALQCANLAAMAAASFFDAPARGVPWQALQALVFWEGLLGGAVYVNAFGRIHAEVPREDRELSLLVASCADSAGINCAAWLSLWLQCALDRRHGRATGSAWC